MTWRHQAYYVVWDVRVNAPVDIELCVAFVILSTTQRKRARSSRRSESESFH
jgi:hypothetical protein